jgi:hypothetical protein
MARDPRNQPTIPPPPAPPTEFRYDLQGSKKIEYGPMDRSSPYRFPPQGQQRSQGWGTKVITILVAILIGLSIGGFMGVDFTPGPTDSDGDGVPDDLDSFPNDDSESADADDDGIGDNADKDDDNDGAPDSEDAFPTDANETSDNDFDGVGDNADPDDDNDGFGDEDDIDPLHDLALSFDFSWVNLTVPLNKKSTTLFQFELIQHGTRVKLFDDDGGAWRVPWQTQFNLTTTFEINVPDDTDLHEFQVKAYHIRWISGTLLDLSPDNSTYVATITYNLSSSQLVLPQNGMDNGSSDNHSQNDPQGTNPFNGSLNSTTLDGSLDNGTDEPDAMLFISVETIHFGYLKSFTWTYGGREYTMSYNFDPAVYAEYNSRSHKINSYDDYVKFATPSSTTMIDFTAVLFEQVDGLTMSPLQEAQYILNFVQSLKYAQDNVTTGIGEYPRYSVETLVEQMGDCEDTAILAGTIAEIRGIESILILLYEAFPDSGHAAPAFLVNASGSYYVLDGDQYFYGESTGSGWQIGETPEFDSSKAYLYAIV